jgi:hypothetical protein
MPRVYPSKLLLVCPRLVARPGEGFSGLSNLARIGAASKRSLEASGQL